MAKVPELLVVDQDPQARFEVKQLVRQAQLGFAGEAGLGTDAVSLAAESRPDVIICGMSRPPERALQTIEALLDVLPETPIIAYAREEDVDVVRQAMLAGARNFLQLPFEVGRLVDSIRSVLESEERKRLRLSGQAKGIGPRGLVVTVFGAKGGVGKTTIATNLGLALASKLGQSVVLIDGDNSFGDVAAMLDMRPERSIIDVIRGIDLIDRANVTDYLVRHSSGLWVLPAPRESLQWRTVTPEAFRKVVDVVARRFDIVLVDTAAILSDLSLSILDEANMVLWVTSTDFSSINNSLLGLEALQQMSYPESRIRLVLNVNSSDDGIRPARIESVLKRQFFWSIPYDRAVRTGAQVGNPAVLANPSGAGARSLIKLAQALTGAGPAEAPRQPRGIGLFKRRPNAPVVAGSALPPEAVAGPEGG
ncbi:MAG TPA: AAA family ATPase [Dehalococcoidia bacterium]|nr:AAA family ATPase [Dehalococcoidia bacterium]